MKAGIQTDAAMFQRTLKQYIATTSKTLEEVITWKAGDLMLTAAKHTPKSKLTEARFKKANASPRLVSYRTGRRFGDGDGKGWNRDQWGLVNQAMQNRTLGKGFMRSAWIKAFGKMPRSKLSKPKGAELEAARLEKSNANVRKLAGSIKGIAAELTWQAHNSKDASLKQSMVDKAIRRAIPDVTASMQAYLVRKMQGDARKASA